MADSGAIEPARSFDRAVAEYERARPGYPAAVLDVLPLGAGAEVLDLGAGTGKLTRVLVERYRRVIAVEPLDGMRAILDEVVSTAESVAGTAEAIPLPDASVDGVFAAQAFHWFANDEAVAEIARVLRPGGVLALVWNESADPSPLPGSYRAYLDALHPPSLDAVLAGVAWSELIGRGPFGVLSEATVGHEQAQDRAGVLAFAQSVSWIAHRPDDERAAIMRDLEALLPAGPFVFPMIAQVNWTVRS
ncbi:MAG TPA: class I SAM-dependent methyltransferase [Gaiellaceae bacterium]|nr:class I SAM-dependent methyltransferase [Gaiellaceae bacterium]